MARFNVSAERFEQEQSSNKLTSKVVMGIAAVGLSAAAVFNMAPAQADEVVGFGGMGDTESTAYEDMLRATGQLGPNDTYHPVPYPASIIGGPTLRQSLNEGLANGNVVLDQAQRAAAPGERVVIRGYSEGGIVASELARERWGDSVAPGSVVIDNSPVSNVGMFDPQDPLVQSLLPVATNMLDVPTDIRAPRNTIVRSSERDVWTMGGPADLGTLMGMAGDTFMGPAHAVQDERAPYYVWVGTDGIVHKTFPGIGTGGAPLGPVGMGGEYAPGPGAPAPAPEAAAPKVESFPHQYDEFYHDPNFKSVDRQWSQKHDNPVSHPVAQPAAPSAASVEDHSRVVVTKSKSGGVNRQTTSYSKKFTPAKH